MTPAKTKVLSGTIAVVVAVTTIPIVFVGVLLAWNLVRVGAHDQDQGAQWLPILAVGGSLVGAAAVFRGVYNALCERWSENIVPPRIRWPRRPPYRPFSPF